MKRNGLFLILGLLGGFLLHALVFPDVLSNGIVVLPSLSSQEVEKAAQAAPEPTAEPLTKTITFTEQGFNRTNITVQSSRYVQIVNDSETVKMDLTANYPGLSTPRPYSYKEQLEARMDKRGTFIVQDRTNTSHRLVIIVK